MPINDRYPTAFRIGSLPAETSMYILPGFVCMPSEHAEDTLVFLRIVESNPLQLETVGIILDI